MKSIVKHPVKKYRRSIIHRRAFSYSRKKYCKTLTNVSRNMWENTFDFSKDINVSVTDLPDIIMDWFPHPLYSLCNIITHNYIVDWSHVEPSDSAKENTDSTFIIESLKQDDEDREFIPDWAVIIPNPSNE